MKNENKKNAIAKAFKTSYLQNINLKEIFDDKELDEIFSEFLSIDENSFSELSPIQNYLKASPNQMNGQGSIPRKKNSMINSYKINELLCDRSKFILNVSKLSCEKFKQNNLNYLAKAVEW